MNPYYLIAATGTVVGVIVVLARLNYWIVDRIRSKEKAKTLNVFRYSFITDMATNHLPHIQHALRLIGEKLDVDLPDPPPIRFMPIDKADSKVEE